ncbi:MAG: transglutaminase family protein [Ferruginibacter sp.]
MKFKVFSELQYTVNMPTTFIFNIQVARTARQVILEENLIVDPFIQAEQYNALNSDGRFIKLYVNNPGNFSISYSATVDLQYNIFYPEQLLQTTPIAKMDAETIPYLFPSRYCQSDKLQRLAYKEFGGIQNTYAQVSAIADWIYKNVEYLSGSTDASTSAYDTLTERAGVCRDFAHLGIALCRALSIPARYFTGYAYNLNPPDFHACFEANIGGEWIFFDPTHLVPVNGLVKISNGRDAADAAVASIFGGTICNSMIVKCESVDPTFSPIYSNNHEKEKGLSYQ